MLKYLFFNIKILVIIMEFGKGVLNVFFVDYSQLEMEDVMLMIIIVWNVIVLDIWYNIDKNEKMVFDVFF